MMNQYNRVCATIDMDAVAYNIKQMLKNIQPGTQMMVVVKADGYGHGAVPIATMLEPESEIWGFAVATLDEGVVLRKHGIKKPILVLGCVFPDQYLEMIEQEIRMTVYTEEMAEKVSKLAEQEGKTAYFHIKLDTGMGRLGFSVQEENAQKIAAIYQMPHVCIEGIFTHFATADERDKHFTRQQIETYTWMVERLKELGVTVPFRHCSNSAGIIDMKEANFDLVRAGISTYGMYPSEDVIKKNVDLKPVLSLTSHIAFVKEVESGTPISYGSTFIAPQKMLVATIPVGYADGYARSLSGKGYVLIRGQRAKIIGRICMDQFMVDVTNIKDAAFGDLVTLIGQNGEEVLPVEVLSDLSERFNYEFVCCLSKRIPRVYCYHGKIEKQIDYFY